MIFLLFFFRALSAKVAIGWRCLIWQVGNLSLPQEVLGCPKWIQHHKKHVRDCQWTSAREFDVSLEPTWLSGLAPSCPETGTPFREKCHFCVFEPSESGFQLFSMHWRARVFLVGPIGTGFREKIQLSRGVGQARALHDADAERGVAASPQCTRTRSSCRATHMHSCMTMAASCACICRDSIMIDTCG